MTNVILIWSMLIITICLCSDELKDLFGSSGSRKKK